MITILEYLAKSLLLGLLFYGYYHFFMRKETYLVVNRFYLIASAILMVLLPLTGILLPGSFFIGETSAPLPVITLPEVVITATRISEEQQSVILNWAIISYTGITLAMMAGLIYGLARIIRFYRRSVSAQQIEENIFLIPGKGSPFSFLGRIFVTNEYKDHPGLKNIIIHENAHIRQRHLLDLIILELFSSMFWFNPFFFLIKRAMREVHEFLADREVIRQGVESVSYQQLLFSEVSGNPQYIIANNFNLLTKKRIVMLIKKSTKIAAIRIWGFLPMILAAAVVITLLQGQKAVAQSDNNSLSVKKAQVPSPPKTVTPPQEPEKVKTKPPQTSKSVKSDAKQVQKKTKDVEGDDVFVVVEEPPAFSGGEEARIKYMVNSIKYPQKAREHGIQGTVYVTYIVEPDGTITNAKVLRGIGGGCDEEALRVVKEMPQWIPGKQKGKPVRVQFNMPIRFALGG